MPASLFLFAVSKHYTRHSCPTSVYTTSSFSSSRGAWYKKMFAKPSAPNRRVSDMNCSVPSKKQSKSGLCPTAHISKQHKRQRREPPKKRLFRNQDSAPRRITTTDLRQLYFLSQMQAVPFVIAIWGEAKGRKLMEMAKQIQTTWPGIKFDFLPPRSRSARMLAAAKAQQQQQQAKLHHHAFTMESHVVRGTEISAHS